MIERTALITCVDRYMGRAIQTKFEAIGITVVTGDYPMTTERDCEDPVAAAGQVISWSRTWPSRP